MRTTPAHRWLPCLALLAGVTPAWAAPGKSFTLLFTGAQRGWVESCGCTMEPLGGVDRVKGEVDKARQAGPVLVVDAGDLLFDTEEIAPALTCTEDARVQLLMRAARADGLALTALGPLDLSRGDAVRARALKDGGVQALAANVAGAADVKPRAVKDVGGVKVGFVGITWPAGTEAKPQGTPWKGLTLLPPEPALAREVAAVRKEGARVVVLLAQASRGDLQAWVRAVPGVDLVLLGRDPGEKPRAPEELVPGTWLLSAGNQGMFLGRVEVTVSGPGPLVHDDGGRSALAEVERLEQKMAQLEEQAKAAEAQGPDGAANAAARRARLPELQAQAAAAKARAKPAAAPAPNRVAFLPVKLDDKSALDVGMARQLEAYRRVLQAGCPGSAP